MKTLEMLGIVLLRFRPIPRAWAAVLIAINACALLFINTSYGQANLVALGAAILVMSILHARLGFVRLLGIGHVFWIPMLLWFAANLPDRATQPWLYAWVVTLMACNCVSLVIDTIDVVRYARGEREPHYRWQESADNQTLSAT
ncbi:MAG: hypothetical protein RH917_18565 [Lacipirellulaceae bacterium]